MTIEKKQRFPVDGHPLVRASAWRAFAQNALWAQEQHRAGISCEADGKDDVMDILVYGVLTKSVFFEGDVTPSMFHDALKGADGRSIRVRIDSPGGDVFAGAAIRSLLREYKGSVDIRIDGLCASAATFIAYAKKDYRVVISSLGAVMIHHPWTFSFGNASDLRKDADELEKISNVLIDIYTQRTGKTAAEISALMDDETLMLGEEAVSNGFADEMTDKTYARIDGKNDSVLEAQMAAARHDAMAMDAERIRLGARTQ